MNNKIPEERGTVTVCNACGTEMPDGALYGDPCNCGEGEYKQHEDAVELEIRRLQGVQSKRAAKAAGIDYEAVIAEVAGPISDTAKGKK